MAKRRRKRGRRGGFEPLFVIVPAAAAIIVIIVLVVLILKKDSDVAADAEPETAVQQETEDMTLSEEADGEAEPVEETEPETAAETDPDEELLTAEQNVAAEVGSMDDSEDPQASTKTTQEGGSGAAVDVSAVQVPEGETTRATIGIDVSKYQGTIDWAAVKNAGVEFAIIRVGYRAKTTGVLYEDPAARYNLQEATKNGIKVGAYFFSSAITQEEAKEEAAWVASFIAKYKITYPVAYNCEDFLSSDSRQYQLTKQERTNLACAFLDSIAAYGYNPMFYASRNEMEGSAQWDMATLTGKYKIWVSQYPDKPYPETPASSYSGTHSMWQYTSQGQVSGIKGKVDVNVAYFGYDQEAEAKDSTPAQVVEANPEIGINFTEVDEQVTAKDETNLRNIPTTEGSTVVYLLKNGETLQRTGIGSNGWDRLIYNGQKVYAVHSLLTTDLTAKPAESAGGQDAGAAQTDSSVTKVGNLTFQTVSEAVTARDKVNLRDFPSTETGNIVGTLSYGEAVVRTGISGSGDTGWSRLEINGQVVYASSRLLATSMDYKEQEKITNENPEAGMHFVAVTGTVMAKDGQTNLRTLPTTNEPSQVVVTLTGDMTAQRIGIDKDKGWTKLSYNGQTVYAVTNYLTVVE
ncbi:MAG: GH25 family lysozyme [Eubacteriales bacterium]|nr:GH25 family lysozyme [Eubacteriales bacterium]